MGARHNTIKPILLIGAGVLGSAILQGIDLKQHIFASDLMIMELNPQGAALDFAQRGAVLSPSRDQLRDVKCVIIALKPQMWRDVVVSLRGKLAKDCIIISVMAGVRVDDLSREFDSETIVRIMPNLSMATAKGVAGLFGTTPMAVRQALAIFEPISTCVVVQDENLIDAVTAVSGSGPAYVFAFVSALEKAAMTTGLSPDEARVLARATLISAASLLENSQAEPDDLIARVASKGGTTQAALNVLRDPNNGLDELLEKAVKSAHNRAIELGNLG